MDALCERRIRYVKAGYKPVPCLGKAPVLTGWQKVLIDIDSPASWETKYPNACNTGIRTKHTRAVDIDVLDAAVADEIEQELRALFPQTAWHLSG